MSRSNKKKNFETFLCSTYVSFIFCRMKFVLSDNLNSICLQWNWNTIPFHKCVQHQLIGFKWMTISRCLHQRMHEQPFNWIRWDSNEIFFLLSFTRLVCFFFRKRNLYTTHTFKISLMYAIVVLHFVFYYHENS